MNEPRTAVLIVCPDHNRHITGSVLRSKIRYVLINEETWWDEPTWYEYRQWGYKYPWIKVHAILVPCAECAGKPVTRKLIKEVV